MKKTLKTTVMIVSLSALTSMAYAAKEGAYAGLGLGASAIDTPKEQLFHPTPGTASRTIGGLGGRAFGGYNFNQYLGVEGGYSRYANSTYKGSSGKNHSSLTYSMSAFDLVGKGYIPLAGGDFNLYGLAGAAYVKSTSKFSNGKVALAKGAKAPADGSKVQNKLRPIVGIGASYNIPQTNLVTNLELSHIQGTGDVKKSASAIPSANMLSLNIAYNFG